VALNQNAVIPLLKENGLLTMAVWLASLCESVKGSLRNSD
jgi:hypothetical protein